MLALESAYRTHEADCELLEADAQQLLLQLRERVSALQDRGRALSELQRHLVRTKQQLVPAKRGHAVELVPELQAVRCFSNCTGADEELYRQYELRVYVY